MYVWIVELEYKTVNSHSIIKENFWSQIVAAHWVEKYIKEHAVADAAKNQSLCDSSWPQVSKGSHGTVVESWNDPL
jgi:hypothetical protein